MCFHNANNPAIILISPKLFFMPGVKIDINLNDNQNEKV